MSAHGVRPESEDIDRYIPSFSDEVVFQRERELKSVSGEKFWLDVTATEHLWGAILLRDIDEHSPVYRTLEIAGQPYVIKALSIEDRFLLKLSADRQKDRRDLPLRAARTPADARMTRFNRVTQWQGNRPELPRFADEFARQRERHYALTPQRIIPPLNLPKFMVEMLWDTYYPEQDDPPQPAPPRTHPSNPSP